MKNSFVLIDTCVWIEYFRRKESPLSEKVKALISSGRAANCGIILYELSQGLKSKEENEILDGLMALPYFDITQDLWVKSGNLTNKLNKQGITIPMSDILIAAIALNKDLSVFTIDKHFNAIPGLILHR